MAVVIIEDKPLHHSDEHVSPIDGELHAFLEALDILGLDILPKTA
jgi:hypothetical protein